MPDAKVIKLQPRNYSVSFKTSSDSAIAHLAHTAGKFGVRLDIRLDPPSDAPGEPQNAPADPSSFTGDGVRLDLP